MMVMLRVYASANGHSHDTQRHAYFDSTCALLSHALQGRGDGIHVPAPGVDARKPVSRLTNFAFVLWLRLKVYWTASMRISLPS